MHRFPLNKNSTIVLTIQIKNLIINECTTIGFATITPIKKGNKTILVIVDYFGVTEKAPDIVLPIFAKQRFRGKGIGKFIIHMIQSIANVICESGSMVLLKCNKDDSAYYEHIGFERIDVNTSGILNIQSHSALQRNSFGKILFSYILKSSVTIDHKKIVCKSC